MRPALLETSTFPTPEDNLLDGPNPDPPPPLAPGTLPITPELAPLEPAGLCDLEPYPAAWFAPEAAAAIAPDPPPPFQPPSACAPPNANPLPEPEARPDLPPERPTPVPSAPPMESRGACSEGGLMSLVVLFVNRMQRDEMGEDKQRQVPKGRWEGSWKNERTVRFCAWCRFG